MVFLDFDESEAITLPRVVRDWLMLLSSSRWLVCICYILLIFYEPARSHRFRRAFYKG